jgi:hypothetical protein
MTDVNTQAPALEETPIPEPELSNELKAHVQTIRAMTICHNLLAEGQFKYDAFQSVHNSMNFLRTVRERAIEMASADPQADLVPELKEFKAAQAVEEAKKKASPSDLKAEGG